MATTSAGGTPAASSSSSGGSGGAATCAGKKIGDKCGADGVCDANGQCVDCNDGDDSTCNGFHCCNEKCVDFQNSAQTCGGCGAAFDCTQLPGVNPATVSCSAGTCVIASVNGCSGTLEDCDKEPGNGCEVDVASDEMNCGGCGQACASVGHKIDDMSVSAVCASGYCTSCSLAGVDDTTNAGPEFDLTCSYMQPGTTVVVAMNAAETTAGPAPGSGQQADYELHLEAIPGAAPNNPTDTSQTEEVEHYGSPLPSYDDITPGLAVPQNGKFQGRVIIESCHENGGCSVVELGQPSSLATLTISTQ